MNDKIAWFEELLALEPNSKLFLSLARIYVQENRAEDAAKALQKGLSFHPEHLEARLLLIKCLARLGDKEAAREESRSLAVTLSGYPVFLDLWAEQSKEYVNQDAALALRLLSKSLKGEAVNWGDILVQGLKVAIFGDTQPPLEPKQDESAKAPTKDPGILPESALAGNMPDASESTPEGEASEQDEIIKSILPLPRPEESPEHERNATSFPPAMQGQPVMANPDAGSSGSGSSGSSNVDEQHLSETERNYYETRTYAALLADQGEFLEALELYNKLLRSSDNDQQRHDLKERIQALTEKIQKVQPQADFLQTAQEDPEKNSLELAPGEAPESDALSAEARQKKIPKSPELVQTLTRLADRLEARGQA